MSDVERKINVQTEKLTFWFPIDAYFRLEQEANAHGLSAPRYARRLLEIICSEGLFRAVDDGADEASPPKKPRPKGANGGGRQSLFVSSG
jgi:hypothetical protein